MTYCLGTDQRWRWRLCEPLLQVLALLSLSMRCQTISTLLYHVYSSMLHSIRSEEQEVHHLNSLLPLAADLKSCEGCRDAYFAGKNPCHQHLFQHLEPSCRHPKYPNTSSQLAPFQRAKQLPTGFYSKRSGAMSQRSVFAQALMVAL